MVIETVSRSLSLCLAALLVVSVVHKIRVVANGEAASQPLIARGGWEASRPTAAVLGAGAVEVGTATALIVAPAVGYLGAAVLLLFYAWELRRLAPDEPCHCFGELFEARRRSTAIARNLALGVTALLAASVDLADVADIGSISQLSVGLALGVAAVAAAGPVLQKQVARERPAAGQ